MNRQLLEAQFPSGTKTKNTGTVSLDSPDRVIPYTDQFTVGFEKALFRNFSLPDWLLFAFIIGGVTPLASGCCRRWRRTR